MNRVPAAVARAVLASQMLGPAVPRRLGDVDLLPHQRQAAGLLVRLLGDRAGALLADDVGLGKTFVALAVAARTGPPLVIAPAAVREHWIQSARRAGVGIRFASVESLSRRTAPLPQPAPTLVIVDEAHHFRNPRTQRFHAVAALCRSAQVLLLSATPVQNRVDELRAMLSLFLGERARAADDAELARYVVRRTPADVRARLALPVVADPQWLPAVDDADCLDRILALPPALPPRDGDDGGALVTFTLVRQWASSRAALVAALRRRLARGLAMLDALRAGRLPSRDELAGWSYAEGGQQLFLTGLLPETMLPDAPDLVAQVDVHVAGVRELLHWLGQGDDPDPLRATRLAALRQAWPGHRIVAFSEFAETVTVLFRALAPAGGVAMLTHGGGRIASGSITRRDVITSFQPGATRRQMSRERIDLLLTTDVLSEGVNLPDARVVVHLDLAWNPARLEQRIGRLRRLDSPHSDIRVFLCAPPAPAERLLSLERRLRVKRALAGRTVGVAGAILPGPEPAAAAPDPLPVHDARIAALLDAWNGEVTAAAPVVASMHSSLAGALACVRVDGACRLVVLDGDAITEDPAVVARFCASAGGDDAPLTAEAAQAVVARFCRWLSQRGVAQVITPGMMQAARSRRRLLDRVERIAHSAPRHARPAFGGMLRAARLAATATLSAGAEEVLGQLATAPLPDDAWLHAIAEFTALHARGRGGDDAVLAVLVLHSVAQHADAHDGVQAREESLQVAVPLGHDA